MQTNEPPDMAVAFVIPQGFEQLRDDLSRIGLTHNLVRSRVTVFPEGLVSASSSRKVRLILLVSSCLVSVLGGLAVALLHKNLGVDTIIATRVAAAMSFAAAVLLLVGLYRIFVKGKRARRKEPHVDGPLSKLYFDEYTAVSKHRARLSWVVLLSIYFGWLVFIGGILAAIFGANVPVRVGGLAAGAMGSAFALFVRGTAMPAYTYADEGSQRAAKAYEQALQKDHQARQALPSASRRAKKSKRR